MGKEKLNVMTKTKRCIDCGEIKDIAEFQAKGKSKKGKVYRSPNCRTCRTLKHNKYMRERFAVRNVRIVYPTLGLANEVGEVIGKIKKIFRDKNGVITDADRDALKLELGDVLWYFTQIATELNLTLEEIADANIEKLWSRKQRGTIHGDGDHR